MEKYFYFNMKIFLAAFCVGYLSDSSPDEDQIKISASAEETDKNKKWGKKTKNQEKFNLNPVAWQDIFYRQKSN